MVLNIDLSKQANFSEAEIISFIIPALLNELGWDIFLTTIPTNVFFPNGTITLEPFLIFITDL